MGFNRKSDDFDASTYVKINERIKEFRELYPEGRITTFRSDTPTGTSFKCVVCRDINDAAEFALTGMAPATGHSFLPNNIRGDKVEEYTETVSVGRALAMLGLKIEKSIATAEEMTRFAENKQVSSTTTTQEAAQEGEDSGTPPGPLPKLRATSKFNVAKLTKEQA